MADEEPARGVRARVRLRRIVRARVIDTDPRAFWKFTKINGLSEYRRDVPAAVYWTEVERDAVAEPRGYLARTVSRLRLDRMKSARAHREHYVGTWLPEPLVEDGPASLASDLSVALLMTLERLSPLERAAFLLHDVSRRSRSCSTTTRCSTPTAAASARPP